MQVGEFRLWPWHLTVPGCWCGILLLGGGGACNDGSVKREKQLNLNWGLYKHLAKCVTRSMSPPNSCAQQVQKSTFFFITVLNVSLLTFTLMSNT